MANDNPTARRLAQGSPQSRESHAEEESEGLLSNVMHDDQQQPQQPRRQSPFQEKPPAPRRQSAIAQPRVDGTPRTQNRVRFDVIEPPSAPARGGTINGNSSTAHNSGEDWLEEEDYLHESDGSREPSSGQRAPLLTDIQAPSVALANDLDFNAEDHLESARPKSGLSSAFMNMANSIIGAGIIGQPYAFKQAGLLTGITLLIVLTITVDWTIRLIVTNSKLSGANSFQATMEHCFGKSGLVAISIAQWAFAFGGMVAFCIIIGDTIPHVLTAIFPTLDELPVLWLLADRRAIIVLFVLGISYPLSLYRDIAMVSYPFPNKKKKKKEKFRALADIFMTARQNQHPRPHQHDRHHHNRHGRRADDARRPPRPTARQPSRQ
jgi:sodium-coupled neutral amino acid transporter 11